VGTAPPPPQWQSPNADGAVRSPWCNTVSEEDMVGPFQVVTEAAHDRERSAPGRKCRTGLRGSVFTPLLCGSGTGVMVDEQVRGPRCGSRGCLFCHRAKLRDFAHVVDIAARSPEAVPWMLVVTAPKRCRVAADVREFLRNVKRFVKSAQRVGALEAAVWVAEWVPAEEGGDSGERCGLCHAAPGVRTIVQSRKGGPRVLRWLDEAVSGVRGCPLCLGRGWLPVGHLHVHVLGWFKPWRWGPKGTAYPLRGGWDMRTLADASGLGWCGVDPIRGDDGAPARYIAKAASDYIAKVSADGTVARGEDGALVREYRPEAAVRCAWLAAAWYGTARHRERVGACRGRRRRRNAGRPAPEIGPAVDGGASDTQRAAEDPARFREQRAQEKLAREAEQAALEAAGLVKLAHPSVDAVAVSRAARRKSCAGRGEGLRFSPKLKGAGAQRQGAQPLAACEFLREAEGRPTGDRVGETRARLTDYADAAGGEPRWLGAEQAAQWGLHESVSAALVVPAVPWAALLDDGTAVVGTGVGDTVATVAAEVVAAFDTGDRARQVGELLTAAAQALAEATAEAARVVEAWADSECETEVWQSWLDEGAYMPVGRHTRWRLEDGDGREVPRSSWRAAEAVVRLRPAGPSVRPWAVIVRALVEDRAAQVGTDRWAAREGSAAAEDLRCHRSGVPDILLT
jgi:hypothetical protein